MYRSPHSLNIDESCTIRRESGSFSGTQTCKLCSRNILRCTKNLKFKNVSTVVIFSKVFGEMSNVVAILKSLSGLNCLN